MSLVRTAALPEGFALWQRFEAGDFIDCYVADATLEARDAAELALNLPVWAMGLLRLRNLLVAPFGLRGTHDQPDAIGPFPVDIETPEEVVLGFDDSHLNFRIAVCRQNNRVFGATWVHCHNGFGRFYLRAIMPFHILLMRNAMRRIARATIG